MSRTSISRVRSFLLHHSFIIATNCRRCRREMMEVKGASVIIYDQTCAAEKRRRRRKGEFPDPNRRVFINELVCEGCGDCGVQSNCVAIQPVETEFGRKRKIDQSSLQQGFLLPQGFLPELRDGGRRRTDQGRSGGPRVVPTSTPFPRVAGTRFCRRSQSRGAFWSRGSAAPVS